MKVAILGTENSHALAFARLIKNDPDFSDIELIGVYGYDRAANEQLLKEQLVSCVADDPHAFVGKADGILVTARHGDHHYEYALPYIKAGCAAFIDKPFTVREDYADELVNAAKQSGALLCGGSSLKFLKELDTIRTFISGKKILGAYVASPVSMVNDYAGFFFYSEHLLEMVLSVFGHSIKSVYAYCPDETVNRVSVMFDYGTFDVMAQYTSSYAYTVSVYADRIMQCEYTFDLGDCYKKELLEFRDMIIQNRLPHPLEEYSHSVQILNAIQRSFREGKRIVLE